MILLKGLENLLKLQLREPKVKKYDFKYIFSITKLTGVTKIMIDIIYRGCAYAKHQIKLYFGKYFNKSMLHTIELCITYGNSNNK